MAAFVTWTVSQQAGGHLSVAFEGWANEARHNCDTMARSIFLSSMISTSHLGLKNYWWEICASQIGFHSQSRSVLKLASFIWRQSEGVWMNSSEIYLGQLLPSVEKYILICGTCFSALTAVPYLSITLFFKLEGLKYKTRKPGFKWDYDWVESGI